MRTAVVVCSVDRPGILHETIASLRRQTIPALEIVLSLCGAESVLDETAALPLVRIVQGSRGLTNQRNNGIRSLWSEAEYVLFLDDDIELAANYLESMEALFEERRDIVLASGGVSAADGPRLGRGLTREEAISGVLEYRREEKIVPSDGAYGCNMFVRRSVLEYEGFDERLVLDGWLEDYDFSVRCSRHGHVVWNQRTCAAHLGVQRGLDEPGFRVGYSQIAHSHYLWRKGVIPSLATLLGRFWLPALRISLQGTLHGKPPWNLRFDYKGRLRGNGRALADAVLLKLKPERILEFPSHCGAARAGVKPAKTKTA